MIYTQEALSRVQDIYDEKQANARFQTAARRNKIYSEIPEVKEIEEKISSEGVKMAIASAKGQEYVPDESLESLGEKRDRLMKEHGYDPDYIQDVYECINCKDSGYIKGVMCECMKKMLQSQSLSYSNIAPALMKAGFEDFKLEYYPDEADAQGVNPRKQMKHILDRCWNFIDNFDCEESKNLLFFGGAGLGKTLLSAAIAKEVFAKGKAVVYYSAKQLLTMLVDYEFGKIPEQKDACEMVYKADLLIIDDLGSEQQNTYTASTLFEIINTRALNGKKMIINTNLSGRDLQTLYSARIFSRINEFETLKFVGNDIRVLKNM